MLRHVVLFKFTDETTIEQIAAATAGLLALPGQIAEIRNYQLGRDLRLGAGSWDFAVTADFDDAAGFTVYDTHPEHLRVRAECFGPIVAERAAVRFEL
jgi:Stress responsive A/B Barrel Domain